MASSSTRVIPRWAAALLAHLVQVSPDVVTRETLARYLIDLGSSVDASTAIKRLSRLGWLRSLSVRGAWVFLPPGTDDVADPYLDLRGWRATDTEVELCLAGDSAAWHLGYLNRAPDRATVWLSEKATLPKGLRGKINKVRTRFPEPVDIRRLTPTQHLLRRRSLDVLTWSTKLPAFGPEALLVQIAARPASFTSWVDLASKLDEVARDVDMERLVELLAASTDSTRQRAAYLLHLGQRTDATKLLPAKLHSVELGSHGPATWHAATAVNDHLVIPLMDANAKA
jgi:hypothetical protein